MPFWSNLKGLRPATVLFEVSLDCLENILADKLAHFAHISQEEALQYLERFDPSNEINKPQEPVLIKVKSPIQEFLELAISAIVLAIAFGIFLSGGSEAFSDLEKLIEISIASLLAVSLGFILHELAHRIVARKYGYIATFSLWILGLVLAVVTSFFSWIFAAPGAVMIRSREQTNDISDDYIRHFGKISIAGPMVNFCLALIFLLLSSLYVISDGFKAESSILEMVLIVGAYVNSILAAFNLLPFGPFDGRKIFKWNKPIWFGAAALAAGLFIFIQSPISSVENINSPKEPTSYMLYTDMEGRFSFNYPTKWIQVTADSDSEYAETLGGRTDIVVFAEEHDSGIIGVQFFDLSETNPDIVIDEALLLDIIADYIRDMDNWFLIKNKKITIDPLADEGQRIAYELIFWDSPENEVSLAMVFTYSNEYIYKLLFYVL
ncbi:site-2 protease family protein [Chloroflexota bacterium]